MTRYLATTLLALASATAAASELADKSLRWVGKEIITLGDVDERLSDELLERRRRGLALPESQADIEELRSLLLETLTDEALLIQEAERLGAEVDKAVIRRRVLEAAADANITLTVEEEVRERQRRSRASMVHAVVGYYADRWPTIGPAEVAVAYELRAAAGAYDREPRVQLLRLVLRPSTAVQRRGLSGALYRQFQLLQEAPDARLLGIVDDDFLSRLVAVEEDDRLPLIAEALTRALDVLGDQPQARLAGFARDTADILERWRALRDEAEVLAVLEAERAALLALPPDEREARFRARARALSQGPEAEAGGDLGWSTPGDLPAAVEALAFALAPGDCTGIVDLAGAHAVYFCCRQEPGTRQPMSEVGPALEAELEAAVFARVQEILIERLRQRAHIEDLPLDPAIPPEWLATASQPPPPPTGSP